MFNNKKISVLHVIEKLNDDEGGLYNIVKILCKFLPRAKNYIITSILLTKPPVFLVIL